MKAIEAIVLDLDGTLLDSNRQITDRSLRAVLDCYDRGIQVIIATARPARSVRMLLPDALLDLGCIIYYNGAHTVDSAHSIEDRVLIDQAIVSELYEAMMAVSSEQMVSFEAQDAMFSNCSLSEEQKVILGFPDGGPVPIVLTKEEILRLHPAKLLLTNEYNIYAELERRFADRVKLISTDGNKLIQIMSAVVSKAAALKHVLQRRGILPEHVMVFGDDYNDLEVFELCGHPVAMGNAIAELKNIAALITETNDRDGVAIVLEQLAAFRIQT
ncbi:Cof-type HAD-IIB family hydrolase [Paenibacillus sp. LMG 31456]|uniref:Cof-type HAD-IIB family hydrolase n=1 Tax=Paenibacillus foliorum TaxID=2654974 RepID=A0A972GU76_9BACL|nr:HAD family hydrolase [Paenibacillus foliorum]NOU96260.1 Cof-type HAD-IIB family hydrolase [Paenibacillus foliorum]